MSHEIRTPLSGVLGTIELLLDSKLTPPQSRLVDSARRSATNLLDLLNDILDFSKIEAGKLDLETVEFDLGELIEDVVQLFTERARRKGLELRWALAPDAIIDLRGDPMRLRQILSNLVGNAIKFTPRGEVAIAVSTGPIDDDRVDVQFEVRDTGIGLEPEATKRIFESFHQADGSTTREYGGTGLGLAISKQLLDMMGGEIEIESTPGEGSTFRFRVSLGIRSEQGRASRHPAVRAPVSAFPEQVTETLARSRILVVEDHPVNQEVIRGMLEPTGCQIDLVGNGRDAIEIFSVHRFDLILMDCQMPVLDGYATTRAIREIETEWGLERDGRPARVPIIAITAHAMAGEQEKCLTAGMDDYLSKPFSQAQLRSAMARWLRAPVGPGSDLASPRSRPQRPSGRSAAAVDSKTLDDLRKMQGQHSSDLLQRAIGIYLERLPEQIEVLEEAVREADADEIRGVAHSLKSSSATLGATRLASLCADLETMGREGRVDAAPAVLSDLLEEAEQVKAALIGEVEEEVA